MGDTVLDEKEKERFLGGGVKKRPDSTQKTPRKSRTCCNLGCCAVVAGVFGALCLILGIVVCIVAKPMLEKSILKSMALTKGSERFRTWKNPPVQPHLEAYVWHVKNPNEILEGAKPDLEERGPYIYKAVTLKEDDGNRIDWNDNGTLTYRPRKFYYFVPERSNGREDDFVTVPNIPLWTGLNKVRKETGFKKTLGMKMVLSAGLKNPFINVTVAGLLWGYEDELPCLQLTPPKNCSKEEEEFSDAFEDFGGDDFDSNWDRRRRKRSILIDSDPKPPYEPKPQAEYIDCKCVWGLFRHRNITIRKPINIFTGITKLSDKGKITTFDNRPNLGFWKKSSICDKVKGQDGGTLPPGIVRDQELEIFISLMCRSLPVQFEQERVYKGLTALRFIPPPNALGNATDNPDNACYCMKSSGYACLPSGVLNMEPCKSDKQAPLALSYPHFYQADPIYREMVHGMKPEKERHQFYVDVEPTFGFPLAMRPRFQLNLIMNRDRDVPIISKVQDKTIVPFLWAQDGFSEPPDVMADKIKYGLEAPQKFSFLGAVVLFIIGGLLLIICMAYFIYQRLNRAKKDGPISMNAMAS